MTTTLERDLVAWLAEILPGTRVYYHHLEQQPPEQFVYFLRAGDERLDTIDASGEPDIIYFDVELWAGSPGDVATLAAALRGQNDYRGDLGDGWVDDIQILDQQDDYEPQATADTLPPFGTAFRLIVSGYE